MTSGSYETRSLILLTKEKKTRATLQRKWVEHKGDKTLSYEVKTCSEEVTPGAKRGKGIPGDWCGNFSGRRTKKGGEQGGKDQHQQRHSSSVQLHPCATSAYGTQARKD